MTLAGVELWVRCRWEAWVSVEERAVLAGDLGEAFADECLKAPLHWMRERGGVPSALYLADAQSGTRLKPSLDLSFEMPHLGTSHRLQTDAYGGRGPAGRRRDPKARAVLVVGDSMSFGPGVEDDETWPAQLEASLRPGWQVFNLSHISFGQLEEHGVLQRGIDEIDPEFVILQVTIANDPCDNLRWQRGSSPLRDREDSRRLLSGAWLWHNPVTTWSAAGRLFAWRWGRHALKYEVMKRPDVLDLTAALIVELRGLCADRPFAVMLAPSVVQVRPGVAEALLDTSAVERGLAERLSELPLLRPLEEMRRCSEPLYIPVDRHWNARGHELAAREAKAWLEREAP